jgi:hypothetical protein
MESATVTPTAQSASTSHTSMCVPVPVTHVGVVDKVIKMEDFVELVSHPSCGAITTFSGVTRDNFQVRCNYFDWLNICTI